jgi:hypothetical protein
MRRLTTYLNSLFLGVILGMIFVAIVHACPSHWQGNSRTSGVVTCTLRK